MTSYIAPVRPEQVDRDLGSGSKYLDFVEIFKILVKTTPPFPYDMGLFDIRGVLSNNRIVSALFFASELGPDFVCTFHLSGASRYFSAWGDVALIRGARYSRFGVPDRLPDSSMAGFLTIRYICFTHIGSDSPQLRRFDVFGHIPIRHRGVDYADRLSYRPGHISLVVWAILTNRRYCLFQRHSPFEYYRCICEVIFK